MRPTQVSRRFRAADSEASDFAAPLSACPSTGSARARSVSAGFMASLRGAGLESGGDFETVPTGVTLWASVLGATASETANTVAGLRAGDISGAGTDVCLFVEAASTDILPVLGVFPLEEGTAIE